MFCSHEEALDDSSSSGTYGASQATVGRETAGKKAACAQALLPGSVSPYLSPLTDSSIFPATTRDIAVQCLEAEAECEFTEEELTIVRRPGEKLGFGLRFEGGGRASETVRRLYIQCCSPQSPAARAACSWGGIVEADQILSIAGQEVNTLTRLQCVKALKGKQLEWRAVSRRNDSSLVFRLPCECQHEDQTLLHQPARTDQQL